MKRIFYIVILCIVIIFFFLPDYRATRTEEAVNVQAFNIITKWQDKLRDDGPFDLSTFSSLFTPKDVLSEVNLYEEKMRNFPAVSALLNEEHTPEEILQMIFEDVKILDSQDLFFECDCSKEKMKNALMTVGKDEIQAMIDEDHGCEMTCQFCNSKYSFSEDELKELLESIQ